MFYSWRIFRYPDSQPYSQRLYILNHWDEYFEYDHFMKETNGVGDSPVFRAELHRFLSEIGTININEGKNLFMYAKGNGQILVSDFKRHLRRDNLPDTNDELIFNFMCFLEVNRFLDEASALKSGGIKQSNLCLDEETSVILSKEQLDLLEERARNADFPIRFVKKESPGKPAGDFIGTEILVKS